MPRINNGSGHERCFPRLRVTKFANNTPRVGRFNKNGKQIGVSIGSIRLNVNEISYVPLEKERRRRDVRDRTYARQYVASCSHHHHDDDDEHKPVCSNSR